VAPAAKDGPRSPGLPVREIAVALIEDGPRIVVARRGDGQHLGGHDEFPGGHREPGESLEECAVREAREETGLEVRVVRRVATAEHVDERRRLALHFFECAPYRLARDHCRREGRPRRALDRAGAPRRARLPAGERGGRARADRAAGRPVKPLEAFAPGRLCLFGEHQDYLGLAVIALAIDAGIRVRLEPDGSDALSIELPDVAGTREEARDRIALDGSSPPRHAGCASLLPRRPRRACGRPAARA
jgi:mutator protein MutT